MIMRENDFREEAVRLSAYLMSISARTAPKSKGEDDIEIIYVDRDDKDKIAEKMVELDATDKRRKGFQRDGENLKNASGLLLIGVNGEKALGLNCGGCGYDCSEFKEIERKPGKDFTGPNCVFKLIDLGIALGSAVKLGSIISVDSRIMYRIGTVARIMGIIKSDVVMGIPLSSTGKNIFFDRDEKKKEK